MPLERRKDSYCYLEISEYSICSYPFGAEGESLWRILAELAL
jgi:hypothetical protein